MSTLPSVFTRIGSLIASGSPNGVLPDVVDDHLLLWLAQLRRNPIPTSSISLVGSAARIGDRFARCLTGCRGRDCRVFDASQSAEGGLATVVGPLDSDNDRYTQLLAGFPGTSVERVSLQ